MIEIGEADARLRFVGVDLILGGSASKGGGYGGATMANDRRMMCGAPAEHTHGLAH